MDHETISLRDWLAGQALQGLLTDPNALKPVKAESTRQYAVRLAEEAYLLADAMLEQRKKSFVQPAETPPSQRSTVRAGAAAGPASPAKTGRQPTVRITGNWRNPSKMEWGSAPALDATGRLERSADLPEEVYQAVEHELAKGGTEGRTFLPNGARIDWFVDR
jgi:hypothetical protein